MINVNRHTLANGLRIVHHEDKSTQMTALNILYDVGARDEDPDHTGFAHLFEHLMFGGSVKMPEGKTMPGPIMTSRIIISRFPIRMLKPDSGWKATGC